MRYRRFGNTDLEVSVICFGPMRFAARQEGTDARSQAGQRALERAIERGVNFIHSSYEYGTRWALGRVLQGHPKRNDLHHVIKVPVPDFDDRGFDAGKFRERVEEALRDLHADRIAVIQHLQRARPNTDAQRIAAIPAVHKPMMETFQRLREEGKVRHLATFPYTPGFARAALDTGDFSGMVAYYNAIEMEMAPYFQELEAKGLGFVGIRPFMAGLLTDRRADRSSLPLDDRMADAQWDAAYQRLALLERRVGPVDSWTSFAVQFALAHPVVSSLVVGLNTPAQVDEVIDAADGDLPDRSVFGEVLAVFREQGMVGHGR